MARMTFKEFYDRYAQYAQISAKKIKGGAPIEVILAFWYWETGGGTNNGTKSYNNLAGINYNRTWKNPLQVKASPSGEYAIYANLSDFAEDYARVLNLSYYDKVRSAFQTAGYSDDVSAISASPYSVADYDQKTVEGYINEFRKLTGSPALNTPTPTYNYDQNVNNFVNNAKASGADASLLALALAGALVVLLKK